MAAGGNASAFQPQPHCRHGLVAAGEVHAVPPRLARPRCAGGCRGSSRGGAALGVLGGCSVSAHPTSGGPAASPPRALPTPAIAGARDAWGLGLFPGTAAFLPLALRRVGGGGLRHLRVVPYGCYVAPSASCAVPRVGGRGPCTRRGVSSFGGPRHMWWARMAIGGSCSAAAILTPLGCVCFLPKLCPGKKKKKKRGGGSAGELRSLQTSSFRVLPLPPSLTWLGAGGGCQWGVGVRGGGGAWVGVTRSSGWRVGLACPGKPRPRPGGRRAPSG